MSKSIQLRWPAEWEEHRATWIAWPHNAADFPGKLPAIQWVYTEIARALCKGERLRILTKDREQTSQIKKRLEDCGAALENVEFFICPTDRSWARDFMPTFVERKGAVAMARFQFNAWAKYPNWKLDNAVSEKLSKRLEMPKVDVVHRDRRVVLEGGGIDSNGEGSLLTTEECFLSEQVQVRNPGFGKKDYETLFREALGVSKVFWLGKGIAGDDTHGHVDDLCRFVNRNTVVLCDEKNRKDVNYQPLQENRERLQGTGLNVVALPMPAPLYFKKIRLPASYANFYIGNRAILVPTFNDPMDRIALGILSECFPDRTVTGIHAVDLVWGFGTLHCLTHEEPAGKN